MAKVGVPEIDMVQNRSSNTTIACHVSRSSVYAGRYDCISFPARRKFSVQVCTLSRAEWSTTSCTISSTEKSSLSETIPTSITRTGGTTENRSGSPLTSRYTRTWPGVSLGRFYRAIACHALSLLSLLLSLWTSILHCHSPGVATVARRLRYSYSWLRLILVVVSTVATPGELQCKIRTGGVRRLAVANGPNIFQMLLVCLRA